MKLYHRLEDFPVETRRGVALAVGNFDGVHAGHQAVLESALGAARDRALSAGVLSFRTHPRNTLAGRMEVVPVLSVWERAAFFETLGFDFSVIMDAEADFFKQVPETFITRVLQGVFNVQVLSVGRNFRFGWQAAGSIELLKSYQEAGHFTLLDTKLVMRDGEVLSSTRVREALERADAAAANLLLGRRVFFKGNVVSGRGIGRILGFPTANLDLDETSLPEMGVYAVWVRIQNRLYSGLMNIGTAPTVRDAPRPHAEIHILDYQGGGLTGTALIFQICRKIREEIRFENLDRLREQIGRDLEALRELSRSGGDFFRGSH